MAIFQYICRPDFLSSLCSGTATSNKSLQVEIASNGHLGYAIKKKKNTYFLKNQWNFEMGTFLSILIEQRL